MNLPEAMSTAYRVRKSTRKDAAGDVLNIKEMRENTERE